MLLHTLLKKEAGLCQSTQFLQEVLCDVWVMQTEQICAFSHILCIASTSASHGERLSSSEDSEATHWGLRKPYSETKRASGFTRHKTFRCTFAPAKSEKLAFAKHETLRSYGSNAVLLFLRYQQVAVRTNNHTQTVLPTSKDRVSRKPF